MRTQTLHVSIRKSSLQLRLLCDLIYSDLDYTDMRCIFENGNHIKIPQPHVPVWDSNRSVVYVRIGTSECGSLFGVTFQYSALAPEWLRLLLIIAVKIQSLSPLCANGCSPLEMRSLQNWKQWRSSLKWMKFSSSDHWLRSKCLLR